MVILKQGSDEEDKVKDLQELLEYQEFYSGNIDGIYGPKTEESVLEFQDYYSLTQDGLVGPKTAGVLTLNLNFHKNLWLDSEDDYYTTETEKQTVALHHISGWTTTRKEIANNNFFHGWDTDGRHVATHFSIDYFGRIYQHYPLKYWAHHLGIDNYNTNLRLAKNSFGIELANEGKIRKDGHGNWKFWAGTIHRDVDPVRKRWRGGKYWANYNEAQYEALEKLLLYLNIAFDIELEETDTHLEMDDNVIRPGFKGIFSHSNVRSDKYDLSPAFKWDNFFENLKDEQAEFATFLGE